MKIRADKVLDDLLEKAQGFLDPDDLNKQTASTVNRSAGDYSPESELNSA